MDTTFTQGTPIVPEWLNEVNDFVFDFPNPVGQDGKAVVSDGTKFILDTVSGVGGGNSPYYMVTVKTAAGIQTQIDAAFAAGGGVVWLEAGDYILGASGIVLRTNVTLMGASDAYVGNADGARLIYSGTGYVIDARQSQNISIQNIAIDASTASGTAVVGVYLEDIWLSTVERVSIKGITKAMGYGILIRNQNPAFYTQHIDLSMIECSDGVIRISAATPNSVTPGADVVTTITFRTVRGLQYEVDNSQVAFINATAESWTTGSGFAFAGPATVVTMVACDIEGAGSPGISSGGGAKWRELGTIWNGFSGAVRVNEASDTLRTYGGAVDFIRPQMTTSDEPTIMQWGDKNQVFGRMALDPHNVTGGGQDGSLRIYRRIDGIETLVSDNRFLFDGIYHVKNISHTAPTLWLSVLMVPSAGCLIEITGIILQAGNQSMTDVVRIAAVNSGGTIRYNISGPQTAGLGPANTYTAVGGANTLNISTQLGTGVAGSNICAFIVRITGNAYGYTLI